MARPQLDGARAARTGWAQLLATSTPSSSVTAPFHPVRGPGEAVALSPLCLGMRSGLCPCLGFSQLGVAPGEALVPTGNNLHPSHPLLHPNLSSTGLTSGAEPGGRKCAWPCWSTAGLSSMSLRDGDGPGFPASVPGQGTVGAWCLRPSHPHALAPCAPPDEHRLPRAGACQVESPGSQESQRCATALPGPPAGSTGGARRGSGGCWDSPRLMCRDGRRHVDVAPLARGARGVLCAWAGGVVGSGAGAAGAPDTCPSPMDTHAVPGLRSLPRALLPREPRGGARSPSLLPRAQRGESQVQHVTNLICSSR